MAPDLLNFNCALVTGGGGGIGKEISRYFISKGKKVIIAGRTESNLQATSKEIGAVGYYVLDTGSIADIPAFIDRIIKEHPDLDCLVNNAGVQRPLQVLKQTPGDFLSKADNEININIRGPLHLAVELLPHFKSKPHALVIYVTSVLGFVPFSMINPVYNGTKSFLRFFSMALRSQLKDTKVRVVEIVPPTVSTALHRERENPNDNSKENNPDALSLEEFMNEISGKLEKGEETIGAGLGDELVTKWYDTFGYLYKD
ncbi:NAD(P)-binding protein [Rostrohypoxylon terebratum]|nr:NAD(P)-binding protein [Rostrohypoxylon terebratum]